MLYPTLARIPITVTPVAVAVYFGAANIDKVLAVIPDWLMNGLTVAGGMLPALGFAIVIKIIGKRNTAVFCGWILYLEAVWNRNIAAFNFRRNCCLLTYYVYE